MENINNRLRVGKKIAYIRKEKGLTQSDLAELTGLKQQNIAKIELGKYNTGIDILTLIGDALGYDLEYIEKEELSSESNDAEQSTK